MNTSTTSTSQPRIFHFNELHVYQYIADDELTVVQSCMYSIQEEDSV